MTKTSTDDGDHAARRFCAYCSGVLEARTLGADDLPRSVCNHCGAIDYDNPKLLSSCTLHTCEGVLFIRRGTEPYKGQWQLPGGFVEHGESPQEAAAREVWEEIRIKIDPSQLVLSGVCTVRHMNQLYLNYRYALAGETGTTTEEAVEIKLLTEADIDRHAICYPDALLHHLRKFYAGLRDGFFLINDYVVDHEDISVRSMMLKDR